MTMSFSIDLHYNWERAYLCQVVLSFFWINILFCLIKKGVLQWFLHLYDVSNITRFQNLYVSAYTIQCGLVLTLCTTLYPHMLSSPNPFSIVLIYKLLFTLSWSKSTLKIIHSLLLSSNSPHFCILP